MGKISSSLLVPSQKKAKTDCRQCEGGPLHFATPYISNNTQNHEPFPERLNQSQGTASSQGFECHRTRLQHEPRYTLHKNLLRLIDTCFEASTWKSKLGWTYAQRRKESGRYSLPNVFIEHWGTHRKTELPNARQKLANRQIRNRQGCRQNRNPLRQVIVQVQVII